MITRSTFLLLPCSLLLASSTALAQASSAPAAAPSTPASPTLAPVSPPSTKSSEAPSPAAPNVPSEPAAPSSPALSAAPSVAPTQTPDESPRGADATPEAPVEVKEEGHSGFAMAFSIGYAVPAGNATGYPDDALSSSFSGQVPLTLEIGGNATPSFFIGAYGTYAPGGLAGRVGDSCNASQIDCSAHSFHGGLALRYRLLPGETVEPWIGYAVGYESNNFSMSSPRTSATGSGEISGWEFGHFSAGVDFLADRMFAFGPFLDVAVGQYGHMHREVTGQQTLDRDISNSGIHEWVTIGVRSVIMP